MKIGINGRFLKLLNFTKDHRFMFMDGKQKSSSSDLCLCGSGEYYSKCCEPFLSILGSSDPKKICRSETLLISWQERYSDPIIVSYKTKTNRYIFRASIYLDSFFNEFYPLGFVKGSPLQNQIDEDIRSIKHNILLTIFGALSCLSEGLLLQSGTLLRTCLEDSYVLMDLFLNDGQADNFLKNKYSTNGLLSRVKDYLPPYLIRWYGYFSANFAHFGPLHRAPYRPSACYADNYVIGSGTENIILVLSAVHIILERIYLEEVTSPLLWKVNKKKEYEFNYDSVVLTFIAKLLEDLISNFPPEEKKEGYKYHEKKYQTKM